MNTASGSVVPFLNVWRLRQVSQILTYLPRQLNKAVIVLTEL